MKQARIALLVAASLSGYACGILDSDVGPVSTEPEGFEMEQTPAEDVSMNGINQFELHILEGNWASLQLGYDLETAWPALQAIYASSGELSLSESDVEAYDWSQQFIRLTVEASDALVAKFARNEEEVEHPEAALDQRAFVVTLDGDPLYGGIFLHPMSSMGISFPVIYAAAEGGKVTFTLRPIHSVLGDYSSYEPGWNGINDAGIHELFASAGKTLP